MSEKFQWFLIGVAFVLAGGVAAVRALCWLGDEFWREFL